MKNLLVEIWNLGGIAIILSLFGLIVVAPLYRRVIHLSRIAEPGDFLVIWFKGQVIILDLLCLMAMISVCCLLVWNAYSHLEEGRVIIPETNPIPYVIVFPTLATGWWWTICTSMSIVGVQSRLVRVAYQLIITPCAFVLPFFIVSSLRPLQIEDRIYIEQYVNPDVFATISCIGFIACWPFSKWIVRMTPTGSPLER